METDRERRRPRRRRNEGVKELVKQRAMNFEEVKGEVERGLTAKGRGEEGVENGYCAMSVPDNSYEARKP